MSEVWGILGILLSLLGIGALMLWFCDGGKYHKGYHWWDMDNGSDYDD